MQWVGCVGPLALHVVDLDNNGPANEIKNGPCSAVGNVTDSRSRGSEFDPGPIPYFRGD